MRIIQLALLVFLINCIVFSACSDGLDTDTSKVSYGIGQKIGRNITNQGMDVDIDAFISGVRDSIEGRESRVPQAEIRAAIQRMSAKMRNGSVSVNTRSLEEGRSYLENNKKKKGVTVTESGLQYKVLKKGHGRKATLNDTVRVHYRGRLIDGTEFDSSYKRKRPAEFPLTNVIKGWQEGLQLMNTGAKYQFTIPSELGYGPRGAGNIPGNSVLVFDVELLQVKKK